MEWRDVEGTNPLYLAQAKVYDRSCAVGPGVLIQQKPMPRSTQIQMKILRGSKVEFASSTTLAELKRDPLTLVEYLFRDQIFPDACFLLTGTGIVPPNSLTLHTKDKFQIC